MKNIRPQKATLIKWKDDFFDCHPDVQASLMDSFADLHRLKKRNMEPEPLTVKVVFPEPDAAFQDHEQ